MSTLKLDSLRHEDCHTALKVSIIVDESCKNVYVTNSINISFFATLIMEKLLSRQPNIGNMMNSYLISITKIMSNLNCILFYDNISRIEYYLKIINHNIRSR